MKPLNVCLYVLFSLIISLTVNAQNFEIGIGLSHDVNRMNLNKKFYHYHFDRDFDTLQITFNQIRMENSISFPIFLRYRFRNGFFGEFSFETKRMTIDLEGSSTYNDATLHEFTENNLEDTYINYSGTLSYDEFYNYYYSSFFNNQWQMWREELSLTENFSVHYLQFNGGYTFSQTNEYRPYITFGLGFFQENHKSSYKKLEYTNSWSDNNYLLYRKMPEFTNIAFLANIGVGVDIYKIRLFASLHFTGQSSFLSKAPNPRNDPANENRPFASKYPYQSFTQLRLGGSMTIIDAEKKDKLLKDKLNKSELISLGEYKENLRKINLIAGVNLPKFTQLKSFYDTKSVKTSFFSERRPVGYTVIGPDTVLNAYNYLEFYEFRDTVNFNGENDMMVYLESNSMEEISRVHKTPDFYLGGIFNVNKNIYLETRLRYYYVEIDQIMARESRPGILYSTMYDQEGNATTTFLNWLFYDYSTEAAILRNTYNNIGLSQNVHYRYKAKQFFDFGGHFGFNLNYWLPGKFKKERNGYNSGKYDEYFYNYWHSGVYNQDIDMEYYYLTDLYKWFEGAKDDYQTYLDDVKHVSLNRFNGSLNGGVDFYFDQFRISLTCEIGMGNPTFFYRNYASFGFGLAYYLLK
jgi:hypothetical protein